MRQNLLLTTVLFWFVCFQEIAAQTPQSETLEKQIEAYSLHYTEHFKGQSAVFSGKIHTPLSPRTEGMYLIDPSRREFDERGKEKTPKILGTQATYAPGNLVYDGVLYTDVLLRLDLAKDELVVSGSNSLYGIVLEASRVGYAEFNGYKVFYIHAGDPTYNLAEGYYAEFYDGDLHLLRKESFTFNRIDQKYTSWSVKYYIGKNGEYYHVKKNKGSVMKVLREYKKELEAYIRHDRISIGGDTQSALVSVAKEYERLNREAGL